MSVVQNPIVGRSSGKFSNAIFAKWKDKNTLRSKPLVVVQPDSEAQLEQRSVFAAIVRYARMVLSLVRFSLRSFSVSMSEFNSFMKLNISLIDTATYKFAVGTLSSLRFSLGSLSQLVGAAIDSASISSVLVSWDITVTPPDYAADTTVSAVVYNLTQDRLFVIRDFSPWSSGSGTIDLVSSLADVLHVYLMVNSPSGAVFSASQYAGFEAVA